MVITSKSYGHVTSNFTRPNKYSQVLHAKLMPNFGINKFEATLGVNADAQPTWLPCR